MNLLETAKRYIAKGDPYKKSLHCALFVRRGQVVSWGINETIAIYPGTGRKSSIHAEEMALKRHRKRYGLIGLDKTDCYSLRVLRNGRWGEGKPCSRCSGLLNKYGLRRVYYSTRDGVTL